MASVTEVALAAALNSTTTMPTSTMAPIPGADSDPVSPEYIKALASNLDQFFIVVHGIIIFYIQAGFAFLEAGSVRSKNTTNILLKNLLDTLIGGIAYWLWGHALGFGRGNSFVGTSGWPILGLPENEWAHWFFQFVYASTSSSIVSGAVAERCSLVAYLSYTTVISSIIYPTCCHWSWSPDGWLYKTAFHDFAGSGVVHLVGGAASIVACSLLGPRTGVFNPVTGRKRIIRGHSTALVALGCFTLFFGILAFNAATLGHISQPGDGGKIALAATNTALSGAAGGLAALVFRRLGWFINPDYERQAWSFLLTVNGMFVGMVAICAGCDSYPTWAAVLCGVGAAAVFLNIRRVTQRSRIIDDPLDAIAVHFGGGWWGLICAALFTRNGFFLSGNREMLLWNIVAGISFTCWAWLLVGTIFGTYRYFGIHRVPVEDELKGMDIVKHKEPAYPPEDWDEDNEDSHLIANNGPGNPGGIKNTVTMATVVHPSSDSVSGLVMRDPMGKRNSSASGLGDDFDFMMRENSRKFHKFPVYPPKPMTAGNDVNQHQAAVHAVEKNVSAADSRKSSLSAAVNEINAARTFGTPTTSSSTTTDNNKDVDNQNKKSIPMFPLRTFSMRALAKKLNVQQNKDDDPNESVYKTVR